MNFDQHVAAGRLRGCEEPAAHVRPRAPLGRDRAGQQQGAVVVGFGSGVGDARLHRLGGRPVQAHAALHRGAPGVGPNPPGVGPATEEQAEAGDHHRLAGAGLASDDGQTPAQGKCGV